MKKNLLLAFALMVQIPAISQTDRLFRPFRLEAGMGYVKTEIAENKYALNFSLEPKYGITDAIWVGLRTEAAVMVMPTTYNDDFRAVGIFSVMPTVDYSFVVTEDFRPFVGLGAGLYMFQDYYDGEDSESAPLIRKAGVCPRIGFEYKRLRVAMEFNRAQDGASYTSFKMSLPFGEILEN